MMEAMERFCRAAASLRARWIRSAKLMVRRGMTCTLDRGHGLDQGYTVTPTHHIDHSSSGS